MDKKNALQRALLLVDDEESILASLNRTLRRDGYQIFTANSAQQGFEVLAKHPVGVIVSDHRMPEMTGTEFLSKVKNTHPGTVRMVLSGYADLQFIADAINRGAIYKFLTKPWEDDLLRANVQEAFERAEIAEEKANLTAQLLETNKQLEEAKLRLESLVDMKSLEASRNLNILQVSQEILEHLPVGVIGVGQDGLIAVANQVANLIFSARGEVPLQGCLAADRLPDELLRHLGSERGMHEELVVGRGRRLEFWCHRIGNLSRAKGTVLVVAPRE